MVFTQNRCEVMVLWWSDCHDGTTPPFFKIYVHNFLIQICSNDFKRTVPYLIKTPCSRSSHRRVFFAKYSEYRAGVCCVCVSIGRCIISTCPVKYSFTLDSPTNLLRLPIQIYSGRMHRFPKPSLEANQRSQRLQAVVKSA